ncbi:polysaccharide deacetylase family protein, partial [Clostridium sporogenes]
MKNKKSLILFAFIIIIAVVFGGCRKNRNIDTNNIDKNKAQSKKQESSVKKSDIRTFTKEPLIYNNKSIP